MKEIFRGINCMVFPKYFRYNFLFFNCGFFITGDIPDYFLRARFHIGFGASSILFLSAFHLLTLFYLYHSFLCLWLWLCLALEANLDISLILSKLSQDLQFCDLTSIFWRGFGWLWWVVKIKAQRIYNIPPNLSIAAVIIMNIAGWWRAVWVFNCEDIWNF